MPVEKGSKEPLNIVIL